MWKQQKCQKISAESVKLLVEELFLIKLNSLNACDFTYKNKLFCRYFLRFFDIAE